MMENKSKGRPPKEERVVRRDHFSVWVTKDEKGRINQLIEKTGLSASQFFLTLALDIPIKRPQKKTLPTRTAEMIRTLEQLSGILSLAVLKTKDHQMQSQQWQQSSQSVKLLANLLTMWVFEDFEIRSTQSVLSDICSWMQQLHNYLDQILDCSPGKTSVLEKTESAFQSAQRLLEKYSRYYQAEELAQIAPVWKMHQHDDPGAVHGVIEEALRQIIKQIRS
jgi:hypothetical protein